ncbi:hypothetical protein ACFXA2_04980 [Micromonospora chalcea]
MNFIPPQQLAQERVVADAVLSGQVDLRAYPHRHLLLRANNTWGRRAFQPLTEAIEHLSNYGWELVTMTSVGDGHTVYAAMRRTA